MQCFYKPSSSLNICIPGRCCTTSGRLAQKSLSRPFQRHTSSPSCTSLASHVVSADFHTLSSLEDPHPLHANSTSLYINLHMDSHLLDLSPRNPEATMTTRAACRHSRAFCSGPEEIRSLTREIAEFTKASSCRSAAQR
jgi:hypothetical protein